MHRYIRLVVNMAMARAACDFNFFWQDKYFLSEMWAPVMTQSASAGRDFMQKIDYDQRACNLPVFIMCPAINASNLGQKIQQAITESTDGQGTDGPIDKLYTAALAIKPQAYHDEILRGFSNQIRPPLQSIDNFDKYAQANEDFDMYYGASANANNYPYFTFRRASNASDFSAAHGPQQRYDGPAYDFDVYLGQDNLVALQNDEYTLAWARAYAAAVDYTQYSTQTAAFNTFVKRTIVSSSAAMCWSLLLTGRETSVIPNSAPAAILSPELDPHSEPLRIWQERCIGTCDPFENPIPTSQWCNGTGVDTCKAECLAQDECLGIYFSYTTGNGAWVTIAPGRNELAMIDGTFDSYLELNRYDGPSNLVFNAHGTAPVQSYEEDLYIYDITSMEFTDPIPATGVQNLTSCMKSHETTCIVTHKGTYTPSTIPDGTVTYREYTRRGDNTPTACKARCMLNPASCYAWSWYESECRITTGVGQMTTSSILADTAVLHLLGLSVSHWCPIDQAYDTCSARCVDIHDPLQMGWCNHRWVHCQGGKYKPQTTKGETSTASGVGKLPALPVIQNTWHAIGCTVQLKPTDELYQKWLGWFNEETTTDPAQQVRSDMEQICTSATTTDEAVRKHQSKLCCGTEDCALKPTFGCYPQYDWIEGGKRLCVGGLMPEGSGQRFAVRTQGVTYTPTTGQPGKIRSAGADSSRTQLTLYGGLVGAYETSRACGDVGASKLESYSVYGNWRQHSADYLGTKLEESMDYKLYQYADSADFTTNTYVTASTGIGNNTGTAYASTTSGIHGTNTASKTDDSFKQGDCGGKTCLFPTCMYGGLDGKDFPHYSATNPQQKGCLHGTGTGVADINTRVKNYYSVEASQMQDYINKNAASCHNQAATAAPTCSVKADDWQGAGTPYVDTVGNWKDGIYYSDSGARSGGDGVAYGIISGSFDAHMNEHATDASNRGHQLVCFNHHQSGPSASGLVSECNAAGQQGGFVQHFIVSNARFGRIVIDQTECTSNEALGEHFVSELLDNQGTKGVLTKSTVEHMVPRTPYGKASIVGTTDAQRMRTDGGTYIQAMTFTGTSSGCNLIDPQSAQVYNPAGVKFVDLHTSRHIRTGTGWVGQQNPATGLQAYYCNIGSCYRQSGGDTSGVGATEWCARMPVQATGPIVRTAFDKVAGGPTARATSDASTFATSGKIGFTLPGSDINAASAGFMCPIGIFVPERDDVVPSVPPKSSSDGAWHPYAQLTAKCPTDRPIRCSHLSIQTPAGGTCEYGYDWTGTKSGKKRMFGGQGSSVSHITKAMLEDANLTFTQNTESMDDVTAYLSKMGQNSQCNTMDISCSTVEDHTTHAVCGRQLDNDNSESNLGGVPCGTKPTKGLGDGGFCGLIETGGGSGVRMYTAEDAYRGCKVWPSRARRVCPPGYALSWGAPEAYERPSCVIAIKAEKKVNNFDTKTPAKLKIKEKGPQLSPYYVLSSCTADQVATYSGMCVPMACGVRPDGDCEVVDTKPTTDIDNDWPMVNSCKLTSPGNCVRNPPHAPPIQTATRQHNLWWPGFLKKEGSFAGVGPAYGRAFPACDTPGTSTACQGFNLCGIEFESSKTCLDPDIILDGCCKYDPGKSAATEQEMMGLGTDTGSTSDDTMCWVSPTTVCGGGNHLFYAEATRSTSSSTTACSTGNRYASAVHPVSSKQCHCCESACKERTSMPYTQTDLKIQAGDSSGYYDKLRELFLAFVDLDTGMTVNSQTCRAAESRLAGNLWNSGKGTCACRDIAFIHRGLHADALPLYQEAGGHAACNNDEACVGYDSDKSLFSAPSSGRTLVPQTGSHYQKKSALRPPACDPAKSCAYTNSRRATDGFISRGRATITGDEGTLECRGFEYTNAQYSAQLWCIDSGIQCQGLLQTGPTEFCKVSVEYTVQAGGTHTYLKRYSSDTVYGWDHTTKPTGVQSPLYPAGAPDAIQAVCAVDNTCTGVAWNSDGTSYTLHGTQPSNVAGMFATKVAPKSNCPVEHPYAFDAAGHVGYHCCSSQLISSTGNYGAMLDSCPKLSIPCTDPPCSDHSGLSTCPAHTHCENGKSILVGDTCSCMCDQNWEGSACDTCTRANAGSNCVDCKTNYLKGDGDTCVCRRGFNITTDCTECMQGFKGDDCQTDTCTYTLDLDIQGAEVDAPFEHVLVAHGANGMLYDGIYGTGYGVVPLIMRNSFVQQDGKSFWIYGTPGHEERVEILAGIPEDWHNIVHQTSGEWLYSINLRKVQTYTHTTGPNTIDQSSCEKMVDISFACTDGSCMHAQRTAERQDPPLSKYATDGTHICMGPNASGPHIYEGSGIYSPATLPSGTDIILDPDTWGAVCPSNGFVNDNRQTPVQLSSTVHTGVATPRACAELCHTDGDCGAFFYESGHTPVCEWYSTDQVVAGTFPSSEYSVNPQKCVSGGYAGTGQWRNLPNNPGLAIPTANELLGETPTQLRYAIVCAYGEHTPYLLTQYRRHAWQGSCDSTTTRVQSVWLYSIPRGQGADMLTEREIQTYPKPTPVKVLSSVVSSSTQCASTCNASSTCDIWFHNGTHCAHHSALPADTNQLVLDNHLLESAWHDTGCPQTCDLCESYFTAWPTLQEVLTDMHNRCQSAKEGNGGNEVKCCGSTGCGQLTQCPLHPLTMVTLADMVPTTWGGSIAVVGPVRSRTTCKGLKDGTRISTDTFCHDEIAQPANWPAYYHELDGSEPYTQLPESIAIAESPTTGPVVAHSRRECCNMCDGYDAWRFSGSHCYCYGLTDTVHTDYEDDCYLPSRGVHSEHKKCQAAISMVTVPDSSSNENLARIGGATKVTHMDDCSSMCRDDHNCRMADWNEADGDCRTWRTGTDPTSSDSTPMPNQAGKVTFVKRGGCLRDSDNYCYHDPTLPILPGTTRSGTGLCSANGAQSAFETTAYVYYGESNVGNTVRANTQPCSGDENSAVLLPIYAGLVDHRLKMADAELLLTRFNNYYGADGLTRLGIQQHTLQFSDPLQDFSLPHSYGAGISTIGTSFTIPENADTSRFQLIQAWAQAPHEAATTEACIRQADLATAMVGNQAEHLQPQCYHIGNCVPAVFDSSLPETIQTAYNEQLLACKNSMRPPDTETPVPMVVYIQPPKLAAPVGGVTAPPYRLTSYQKLRTYAWPEDPTDTEPYYPRFGPTAAKDPYISYPTPGPGIPPTRNPTPAPYTHSGNFTNDTDTGCQYQEYSNSTLSTDLYSTGVMSTINAEDYGLQNMNFTVCLNLCAKLLLCKILTYNGGKCLMYSFNVAHTGCSGDACKTSRYVETVVNDCTMSPFVRNNDIVPGAGDAIVAIKEDCCFIDM